jgi:hypothetical protein
VKASIYSSPEAQFQNNFFVLSAHYSHFSTASVIP